jgi:hypothetical protein
LCEKSGAAFRQRWLEDHVLSDSVLGQAVPQFVRDFCPTYPSQVGTVGIDGMNPVSKLLNHKTQAKMSGELTSSVISEKARAWLEAVRTAVADPVRKALRQVRAGWWRN